MGIIRIAKTENYTVMSNYHLRDKGLTLKAKGLMSLMLSLPDDWDYSIAGLVSIVSEGESAIRSALKELEELHYLVRERVYENGRISDWNYTLYEMPTEIGLDVENQQVENQVVENRAQINKDINKVKNHKSTGAGALAKTSHSRSFRNEQNHLEDKLSSGKEIDEQTKEKKKVSEYDKCLAVLQNRDYSEDVIAVAKEHLYWSFNSRDPKRIRTAKIYSKRLDELEKIAGDLKAIIQQSIDKQWHCFYEVNAQRNRGKHECFEDTIVSTPIEEARAAMREKRERGAKTY